MNWGRHIQHQYPAAQAITQMRSAAAAGFSGGDTEVNDDDAQGTPVISAKHHEKLTAYARRLRMVGIAKGTIALGPYTFEIAVDAAGYTVKSQRGGGLDVTL